MNQKQKLSLFLLRISLGLLFFYAGITKVLNPNWSAAGYLNSAKTFSGFYHWLASSSLLPFVNFINEWGLLLLGVSLILGLFVRWSSIGGILLMILYYLPILRFPYPDANSYIVDQHIIFIFVLVVFIAFNAGKAWGLDSKRIS